MVRPATSSASAWIFVGCGAAAVAGYPMCPPAVQTGLFVLIEVVSIAALVLGVLRQPEPEQRRPWWAVVSAVSCFFGATILRVAHQLGQRVVAEGVETTTQRDWLRDRDCDLIQGYLYGRPEPAGALADVVRHGHRGDLAVG